MVDALTALSRKVLIHIECAQEGKEAGKAKERVKRLYFEVVVFNLKKYEHNHEYVDYKAPQWDKIQGEKGVPLGSLHVLRTFHVGHYEKTDGVKLQNGEYQQAKCELELLLVAECLQSRIIPVFFGAG